METTTRNAARHGAPWASLLAAACIALASDPALAAQRCYDVAWTPTGAGTATGDLEINDSELDNPSAFGANNYNANPAVWTSLEVTIAGASSGNGTFVLGSDLSNAIFDISGALDLDSELVAQGFVFDFNVLGMAPAPNGFNESQFRTNGGAGDEFTLSSITPKSCVPFPVEDAARKCQDTIGKAGGKYFAAQHTALTKCRASLMQGKELFEDAAGTIPVVVASQCADEAKTVLKLTKARQKLRDSIAKTCTDTILAGLRACAATVDGLADATGSTGCIVNAVDNRVESLLEREYGF